MNVTAIKVFNIKVSASETEIGIIWLSQELRSKN